MLRALAFVVGMLPAVALGAASVTAADLTEIRAVISEQIDAFRRDDARGAFALASPGVQRSFGSAERFLDTVRSAYRAVYRPASVAFLELVMIGEEVVQPLKVTDASGAVWLAYYAMQRQEDGSWRTSGCHLAPPARTISA